MRGWHGCARRRVRGCRAACRRGGADGCVKCPTTCATVCLAVVVAAAARARTTGQALRRWARPTLHLRGASASAVKRDRRWAPVCLWSLCLSPAAVVRPRACPHICPPAGRALCTLTWPWPRVLCACGVRRDEPGGGAVVVDTAADRRFFLAWVLAHIQRGEWRDAPALPQYLAQPAHDGRGLAHRHDAAQRLPCTRLARPHVGGAHARPACGPACPGGGRHGRHRQSRAFSVGPRPGRRRGPRECRT
jgi:hypothetical protein